MKSLPNSNRITHGFRIEVTAEYLPRESSPEDDHYFFSYRVRITNEGDETARLVSRHWVIINAEGERHEVRGPGVLGETPKLAPGDDYSYMSYCPLDTHWGTMEGCYHMERSNGTTFEVAIGRFYLVATAAEPTELSV